MSAELLERAAKVLREHAERTAHAPADLDWNVSSTGPYMDGRAQYSLRPRRNSPALWAGLAPCGVPEYIALMHPPVALALAAWLESEVGNTPAMTDDWESVIVARAILREEP